MTLAVLGTATGRWPISLILWGHGNSKLSARESWRQSAGWQGVPPTRNENVSGHYQKRLMLVLYYNRFRWIEWSQIQDLLRTSKKHPRIFNDAKIKVAYGISHSIAWDNPTFQFPSSVIHNRPDWNSDFSWPALMNTQRIFFSTRVSRVETIRIELEIEQGRLGMGVIMKNGGH